MLLVYTVLLYTYKALHECAAPYICELIELYVPRRSLRSRSRCMLDVPKIKTKKYGARQFSYAAAILFSPPISGAYGIDTIFTNSTSVKSGLIMDNISDHLPILCISDISFKRTQIPIREKS